jgi:hypothetical protein
LNHSQLDQLGFVGKAMAIGRRRGFSDMATEIVMACACGGMAMESDSRRGSYHRHHPVQRTLCRVSETSPSEAELERDIAILALVMMLCDAILL